MVMNISLSEPGEAAEVFSGALHWLWPDRFLALRAESACRALRHVCRVVRFPPELTSK